MAHEVLMPKLSSTMSEGTITMWLKQEGDPVAAGDAVFEVMTDKIAIEVEAYEEGILLKRYIGDGESAPVNAVIGYIGAAGEEVPEVMPAATETATTVGADEAVQAESKVPAAAVEEVKGNNVRATPAARRMARELGVQLELICGSGPKGRIQVQDVKDYSSACKKVVLEAGASGGSQLLPWSGMRQAVAEQMTRSKATIPHVTMQAQVSMQGVVALRQQLLPLIEKQTGGLRLSYLEIIMKATLIALRAFPIFNAHGTEAGIRIFDTVNLGMAVALEDGLIVPVIHEAEKMGLAQLTEAVKARAEKARGGQLTAAELQGGTFTISSLGRSRVQSFDPIINAPEAAILGIGGMAERWESELQADGRQDLIKRPIVTLSLSFDHRIVDGAPAAAFLTRIVELLEEPMSLLL